MAREVNPNELKLQQSISILDYYNTYVVPLDNKYYKLSEGRHVGLCPFHDETDASFHYWGAKNMYHCFGCNASGDIIKMHQSFLSRHKGVYMSRSEATKDLARLWGIELDESAETPRNVFQSARQTLQGRQPLRQFSLAKFRQLNNQMIRLNIPIDVKVDNYAKLDREMAVYILNGKENQ